MGSHRAYLGPVKVGQDVTFALPITTRSGQNRPYSGSTPMAWLRPVSSEDADVAVQATLDEDPDAPPQVLVTLTAQQTASLTAPGQVDVDVTVTHESGVVDKPSGYFDIVEANVHAG